ncbi:MAG TPA: hypothetical protein DCE52_00755 [Rhodobacteraceae bacterium]|nr:hypothetical protein [Paracoccaceae bacterium]
MAKFINKKEQVYDLKLTSYGHYLLSNGTFKPKYYGFYDDNIIYDGSYVNRIEHQNKIRERIKEETQYIESLVLFEEVENSPNTLVNVKDPEPTGTEGEATKGQRYYMADVVPITLQPRNDVFRFELMLGDAFLEGNTNHLPAWKMVTLHGQISGSSQKDQKNDIEIPQIDVEANYYLKVENAGLEESIKDTSYDDVNTRTSVFADNRIIKLQQENIMVYLEELNTILLNDNFEVEVFEIGIDAIPAGATPMGVIGPKSAKDLLIKKDFVKDVMSLKGDLITEEYINGLDQLKYLDADNTNNVEYYFNIRTDHDVNQAIACRGAETFNKESYYVDFDFECEQTSTDAVYYDIYGPVTDPEICS